MFGISLWEVVIVAAVALILIRPADVPRIARAAGKLMRKVRSSYEWIAEATAFEDTPAGDAGGRGSDGDEHSRNGGGHGRAKPRDDGQTREPSNRHGGGLG